MKKALLFLIIGCQCVTVPSARAAVAIKKAAPVATKESSGASSVSSMLPAVIELVQGVRELSNKSRELTAECVPTQAEINFVNETMKEWAKTGAMSSGEVATRLKMSPCVGNWSYKERAREALISGSDTNLCYDSFNSTSDKGMIWENYPKASLVADLCTDGTSTCKDKKTKSNIYEIFNLIDFVDADYSKQEATMAGKILSKVETCSSAKLNAKKRAMWGEFIVSTVGNVGQGTNTAAIMESVSTLSSSGGGGGLGSLGSLGSIATQFLNK